MNGRLSSLSAVVVAATLLLGAGHGVCKKPITKEKLYGIWSPTGFCGDAMCYSYHFYPDATFIVTNFWNLEEYVGSIGKWEVVDKYLLVTLTHDFYLDRKKVKVFGSQLDDCEDVERLRILDRELSSPSFSTEENKRGLLELGELKPHGEFNELFLNTLWNGRARNSANEFIHYFTLKYAQNASHLKRMTEIFKKAAATKRGTK